MAGKTPTKWTTNTAATTNQRPYDSGTQTYDSSTKTYDGNVSGQSTITTKTPTKWSTT